jgi:hypothetical protein
MEDKHLIMKHQLMKDQTGGAESVKNITTCLLPNPSRLTNQNKVLGYTTIPDNWLEAECATCVLARTV